MEPVTRADDYDAVTATLLRQVVEEARQERDALRVQLDAARTQIRELEGRLGWAEAVIQQTEAARRGLEAHLAAIQSGLGWAVLQRFRRLKGRVLAPGSAVERTYARLTRRLAHRFERR